MAEPQCPYFGTCGGCSLQHVDYPLQIEEKKRQLAKYTGFDDIHVFFDKPYGYRNRMDFVFHSSGIGFREKGKWWKIADIKHCAISEPRVNDIAQEIRAFFEDPDAFDLKTHAGTLKYAVVRTTDSEASISFVVSKDSATLAKTIALIKQFADTTSADHVLITYQIAERDDSRSSEFEVIKGHDELTHVLCGKTFTYSVQGFFQNNHVMAEKLQQYVRELLETQDTAGKHLLDLYAGVGTFGILNADLFESVIMVEEVSECIDSAKKNAARNNAENISAHVLKDRHLKQLELPVPLIVVTDPPRSGMHPKTIKHLNRLKPERIIYVSCNPKLLARELTHFDEYDIKSVALFDLFPQTPHLEAVVELARK